MGEMYRLDMDAAASDENGELVFGALEECWPDSSDSSILYRLVNGTTFCDMIEVLQDPEVALAIFEYGRLHNWWKLVYDPNQRCIRCSVGEEAHIGCQCVVRIEQFRQPPRHAKPKRERVPLASKFRDLLFPERGIAIA